MAILISWHCIKSNKKSQNVHISFTKPLISLLCFLCSWWCPFESQSTHTVWTMGELLSCGHLQICLIFPVTFWLVCSCWLFWSQTKAGVNIASSTAFSWPCWDWCSWLLDRIYQFGMSVWSGSAGGWQCNHPYKTTWHTWWPSQNATLMTFCVGLTQSFVGSILYRFYSDQLSTDAASKELNIDATCPSHFRFYTYLIWPLSQPTTPSSVFFCQIRSIGQTQEMQIG